MNKTILFISCSIAAVFGFIILNFGLFNFFHLTLGASKDFSKLLLAIGWIIVAMINLFYFGIIKEI